MADLQGFVNTYNGKFLTITGPDAGQCTAIAHRWEQLCGKPLVYGNAIDTYANAGADYDKIANTPTNVPEPGDILVWGQNSSVGTGSVGHTAVFVSGDQYSFNSFDQNWPTGSVCKIVHHDYRGVIGWFRPKGQPTNQGVQDVISADDVDNLYRQLLGRPGAPDPGMQSWVGKSWHDAYYGIKDSPEGKERTINLLDAAAERGPLRDQLNAATSQIASLQKQLDDQKKVIADLQAHVSTTNADTDLLNSFGKVLVQLIARLGLK